MGTSSLLKALITCLKVIIIFIRKVFYALKVIFHASHLVLKEGGGTLNCHWSKETEYSARTTVPSNQSVYTHTDLFKGRTEEHPQLY